MKGTRRKKLVLILLVALALAGFLVVRSISFAEPLAASFTSSATLSSTEASQVKEIQGYRNWTKVNPQPLNMDVAVAALCAAPPSSARANDKNPHLHKFITVYVNDVGRRAMMEEREPKFPQGSVIVKEKLPAQDSETPELLTVMIKREKGFNPETGDWEFMVTNGAGSVAQARGKISSCQSCHINMGATDFIYRTYLPASTRSSLKN
jgi:hypothetical protein